MVALCQCALDDWSDPEREEDVVQPSNENHRTAPPEESAAGHTVHNGEWTAASSNHSPYDWLTLFDQ
jgi:hypothetical protein